MRSRSSARVTRAVLTCSAMLFVVSGCGLPGTSGSSQIFSTEPVQKVCSPAQQFLSSTLAVGGARISFSFGKPTEEIRSSASCTVQSTSLEPSVTAELRVIKTTSTSSNNPIIADPLAYRGPVVSAFSVGDTSVFVRYKPTSVLTSITAITSTWVAQWTIKIPPRGAAKTVSSPLTAAQLSAASTAVVNTIRDST